MATSTIGFYRVTLSLLLCVLLTLSFLPLHYKQDLHTKGALHDPGHFAVFALLSYLASKSATSATQRLRFSFGLAAVALGIEVAQQWVMGTPMEWLDVLLDCAGTISILAFFAARTTRQTVI